MPTIPTTSDGLEVADYGSDIAYGRVIDDLDGTTTDTWAELPIRDNFEISVNSTVNSKTSEGGTKRTTSTEEEWILKYVTQQVSKAVLYSFPKAIDGLLVQFVLELNSKKINGKNHYVTVIGKLSKRPGIKNKTSPEFEFGLLAPTDDLSITVNKTTFGLFSIGSSATGTLNHLTGEFFGMVEI